jgi:hypothetical protein
MIGTILNEMKGTDFAKVATNDFSIHGFDRNCSPRYSAR